MGTALSASPYPFRACFRLALVSDWSAVRISSIWTAVVVCVVGIVDPLSISGALGLPGCSSRKKFPSRNSRGRSLIVASSWIGSASSSTLKVASAMLPSASTELTLPTLTPAIRTREFGFSVVAFSKVAWSS